MLLDNRLNIAVLWSVKSPEISVKLQLILLLKKIFAGFIESWIKAVEKVYQESVTRWQLIRTDKKQLRQKVPLSL